MGFNPLKLVDHVDKNNTATPETLLLAEYIDNNFIIEDIQPLIYFGAAAAAPFNVYDANTLYFGLSLVAGGIIGDSLTPGYIILHDENDVVGFATSINAPAFDTVGLAKFNNVNQISLKDVYFGRYVDAVIISVKFIGYKITRQ